MDLSTLANLINAGAVTAGVIFAAVQIHHYRQRRRRDAMLELLRSFQSRDFTRALCRVNSLPDGADLRKIREVLGPEGPDDVFMVGLTWESLGVLRFRHEVTIELMDRFFQRNHRDLVTETPCSCGGRSAQPDATLYGNSSNARGAEDREGGPFSSRASAPDHRSLR
jgi:hypothetical protein